MKFKGKITGSEFNTNDYLSQFVDEFTGEIKPQLKVLDKRVRKHWFVSSEKSDKLVCKVTINRSSLLDQLPESVLLKLAETSDTETFTSFISNAFSEVTVTAHVQIIDRENHDAVIAENYATRKSRGEFQYITEAAINAALDRCLVDLGYVVPEEIEKAPNTDGQSTSAPIPNGHLGKKVNAVEQNHNVTASQKAIADIEALVDSESDNPKETTPMPSSAGKYDQQTPVEEIMANMSTAEARSYTFAFGKYKGMTVGEVYEQDKDRRGYSSSLNWFAQRLQGKDNILVAAIMTLNKNKKS